MAEDGLRFLSDGDWERPLSALRGLKDALQAVGFEATVRLPYPGGPLDVLLDPANIRAWRAAESNLFYRSAVAGMFRRRMARTHPRAVALHELLTLGRSIDRGRAVAILGASLLDRLIDARVFEAIDGSITPNVLVVASSGLVYVSDPVRVQDHPDYVYAGRSSFSASDYLAAVRWQPPSKARRRLLDLGCGAGFAAVAAAAHGFEQVIGSDIVGRCLHFGRLNAALNGVERAEFVRSDLFSEIRGDFDVIVSNAPCVWEELQQATFATGGGAFGTELPVRMISESLDHLRPDGLLLVVMTAPVVGGRAYVRDAVAQACGDRGVEVRIHPLISEYDYEHADVYRRNRISQFVRYLVTMTPGPRRSIRLLPGRDLRFACYRARSAAVRAAAGLSRAGKRAQ